MNWLARHRLLVFAAICASCAGLMIAGALYPRATFLALPWHGERVFQDQLRRDFRKTARRDDFAFIAIDQSSLQLPPLSREEIARNRAFQLMTERPYPWSRELWALLLDRLFAAGARLVIFDMLFNPPNDGDPIFRAALDRYRDRVVLGANFDMQNGAQLVLPNPNLVPPPAEEDERVGYVNYFPDGSDGKVRSARFFVSDRWLAGLPPHPSAKIFPSLATRALLKLGQGSSLPHDEQDHLFRFSSEEAYPALPLYQVFDPRIWQANYADGAFFKNKIVVVGASSQIQHDFVDTPLSPNTPGPVVHLEVMAAAMAHQWLHIMGRARIFLLIVAAALLAGLINVLLRRPLLSLLLLLVVCALYLATARLVYDQQGLLLATVPVLATFLLSGVSTLAIDFAIERMEKLRTRRTLERYVSRNLVKELLENPAGFYSNMRGTRKPVTVLFSDLIGFTTLSEHADPEALVQHLNEYLTEMVRVVFAHGGTLDKFIGDAIMAVWGNVASKGVAEDAKACAHAALSMRRELRVLNARWRAEGRMMLGMGVGINQGEALLGNIGSAERLDPTVIGDAVNLASRLEGLTRTYGVDILVGPRAAELIADEFYLRSVARAQVKGRSEPVEIFTIVEARESGIEQESLVLLETYEEGIRRFRAREFSRARLLFSRYLESSPNDFLARLHLDRAVEYEQTPPDGDWRGVEVFTRK